MGNFTIFLGNFHHSMDCERDKIDLKGELASAMIWVWKVGALWDIGALDFFF